MCINEFKRLVVKAFILLIPSTLLWSCIATTHHVVEVNGYTGGKPDIKNIKTIIISTNPKAQNPLLEEEIARKISNALISKGYTISNDPKKSEYILLFNYGIGHGRTYTETYSYDGTRLNIRTGKLEPTTEVGSSVRTEYTRHLTLKLYESSTLSEDSKPIWVGEVYSTGNSSDMRKVINYLIRGAVAHFGKDTVTAKTHEYIDE